MKGTGTFEVGQVVTRDPSVTPAAQDRARREEEKDHKLRPIATPAFAQDDPDYTEMRIALHPHAGESDDVAVASQVVELVVPYDEDIVPGVIVEVSFDFKIIEKGTARSWAVGGPGVNAQGDPYPDELDGEPRNTGNATRGKKGSATGERPDGGTSNAKTAKATKRREAHQPTNTRRANPVKGSTGEGPPKQPGADPVNRENPPKTAEQAAKVG